MTVSIKRLCIKKDGAKAFCEYTLPSFMWLGGSSTFGLTIHIQFGFFIFFFFFYFLFWSYNSYSGVFFYFLFLLFSFFIFFSQHGHPTMLFPHTTGARTCCFPLAETLRSLHLLCSCWARGRAFLNGVSGKLQVHF